MTNLINSVNNKYGKITSFKIVPNPYDREGIYEIFIDDVYTTRVDLLENELNFFGQALNGYKHHESSLISNNGNISLTSSNGVSISGGNISAQLGQVNLEASGVLAEQYKSATTTETNPQPRILNASIIIDGHTDFYDKGNENDANYSMRTLVSPTIINGDKGVNIRTVGKTKDDNLVLQATGITSKNGDVKIESNKSILFDAAIEQSYDLTTTTEKKKSWGGLKKKYVTTVSENNDTNAASVDISGKNISIETKKLDPSVDAKTPDNNIDIYSGRFTANGGKISINSGGNLNFYTVEESSSSDIDITKKSSFAGIKYNTSKTNATRTQVSELPATLKADYIGTKSGFDTRLVGTEFEYLKGASIEAGGKLDLIAAKTSITDLLKKEKNSVVWQSMQDKGSITETAQLPSFNGPVLPTFKAAGGLSIQVPMSEKDANKVELRDEILKLANQPGNTYLKEFVNRKDIDWQTVLLTQKDWDYKQQGLTGAGAAIIALIVIMATAGAGTAIVGALGGSAATLGGSAVAMTQAAVVSLTTQASVSLINNGGDIGKTLKDLGSKESVKSLAISVVTAGLMESVSINLKIDLKGFPTAEKIANNFVQGVGSNLINSTLQGESLSDSLNKALLAGLSSSVQGELATKIKGLEDVDYVLHKIAHAAAGCLAGALQKSCESGAIGAAIGEIVAGQLNDGTRKLTLAEKEQIINQSKLVAGVVAAYTGYDVNIAASSADSAVRNNNTAYAFDPAAFNEIINEKAEPLKVAYYRDKNNQVMMCLSAFITPCNVSGSPVSISEIFDALVGPTLEVIDKTPQGQGKKRVVNVIEELVTKKSIQATGRVASRVNVRNGDANITGSGLEYAWKKHGGSWGTNKSAFTISKDELKLLLQNPRVVNTPAYQSSTSGNYIRTVDVGKNIGIDSKNGSRPTSIITVITDRQGNLVNTFPGKTIN